MNKKYAKRVQNLILGMMLVLAMTLIMTGCSSKTQNETTVEATTSSENVTVLGEGSTSFRFGVYDMEAAETWFEIHTDEKTVGAALLALELIAGDDGPYGLYVKTVNGITADYDKDKVYWAFYVNDEYGTSGVDQTEIEEGAVYSFRMAK